MKSYRLEKILYSYFNIYAVNKHNKFITLNFAKHEIRNLWVDAKLPEMQRKGTSMFTVDKEITMKGLTTECFPSLTPVTY